MGTTLLKIKNSCIKRIITVIQVLIFFLFAYGATVENLEAVQPDEKLYSNVGMERDAAYREKGKLLEEQIGGARDEKVKQAFLVQQQLLAKLKEMPDNPEKPSMDLHSSELAAQHNISWKEFEQYLLRYISLFKERKISEENLENTKKETEILKNQLLALADNDSEENILQLQHAYQVRKHAHQSEIDKHLRQGLNHAKDKYPKVLEGININRRQVNRQLDRLEKAKWEVLDLEDQKKHAAASDDAMIQQQESLMAGYLGHELSDTERKVMHYEQLKLLHLKAGQIFRDSELFEAQLSLLEEEQILAWYRLLTAEPEFFKLADISGDIETKVDDLRKKANAKQVLIYTYEKELSALSGGNALIGPKAQELISALEEKIRSIFTQLSGVDQRAEALQSKGLLLERAIDLKQSALGSLLTRTQEATDDIFEKVMSILKFPLISYSGMNLTMLLFLEILALVVCGIIISRIYGHVVVRMGKKRRWSERTIHLVHAAGKYPFICIFIMMILSVVGINTSSLAIVAGALSVGIGFGMQTIVNNLVSGIILFFDKSIKPGDFISLGEDVQKGGFRGNVVQMNIRTTVLRTNDNINIIIPNADLMASQVVNWTYSDEKIRFRIPFSVAYGTNVEEVKALVKEAVLELPVVLSQPEPQIWMAEHAQSSVAFLAAIWVEGQNARQPAKTFDIVLSAIYTILNKHGIEIPFPRMDLRLRGSEQHSSEIRDILGALRNGMLKEVVS